MRISSTIWEEIGLPDFMTPEQRSRAMSSIGGRDTKAELAVRSQLHRMGFRFRKNVRSLAGSPDIVLPKYNAVIFIHGCFWHGHEGCSKSKLPATQKEFWDKKITANRIRDRRCTEVLRDAGWRVAVVWECCTNSTQRLHDTVIALEDWLHGFDNALSVP